jgi:dienelactone hydrolase
MSKLACLFLLLAVSGCPDIKTDGDETANVPVVEFDPSNKIVPFPNNLLLDPATGKVNLPQQCGETATTKALREGVLNKLDGFGQFEAALTVTFSEGVDMASLADRVVLYKRATGTTAADPATATPIPVITRLTTAVRFDASCTAPTTVPQLAIIPRVPLEQNSTYVVALLDGIKTVNGGTFQASGTWRLIRGATDPVTIVEGVIVADQTPLDPGIAADRESLLGIDLLWKVHAQGLKFLTDKQHEREKILIAWEFKTQTSIDPLDPTVAGSPATKVATTPLAGNASQTANIDRLTAPYNQCQVTDSNAQCYLKIVLGKGNYTTGNAICGQVGCAAIGDVVGSGLVSKQYQIDTPNAYTGTGAKPVPGPWSDPKSPTEVKDETISVLGWVPATAAPATGYPVVIFQHGLGQGKTNAFAIAGSLANAGFLTVAIDAVAHDSRAVRISNAAALGCTDVATSTRLDKGPSPIDFPQCYAPFLSTNLGATRDAIRQTVLDQQRLVAALKACGTTACNSVKIDPTKIVYLGQSLGGIIGAISVGLMPDIKAAALNVTGVGWVDILENTATLRIQCLLVDGLIDAGILVGEKSSPPGNPTMGLCTTPAWKTQPGYQQFSVIGRWIFDPADPANYTRKLAQKRVLLQEVDKDTVVPNLTTANLGALLGLMSAAADPAVPPVPPAPPASAAITTNPMTSKWVRYVNLPANGGTGFPGNTFHHASLLSPTLDPTQPPTPDGSLGVARVLSDVITYLSINR